MREPLRRKAYEHAWSRYFLDHSIEDNPYDGDLAQDWNDGWNDAHKARQRHRFPDPIFIDLHKTRVGKVLDDFEVAVEIAWNKFSAGFHKLPGLRIRKARRDVAGRLAVYMFPSPELSVYAMRLLREPLARGIDLIINNKETPNTIALELTYFFFRDMLEDMTPDDIKANVEALIDDNVEGPVFIEVLAFAVTMSQLDQRIGALPAESGDRFFYQACRLLSCGEPNAVIEENLWRKSLEISNAYSEAMKAQAKHQKLQILMQ